MNISKKLLWYIPPKDLLKISRDSTKEMIKKYKDNRWQYFDKTQNIRNMSKILLEIYNRLDYEP
jgi:hypothetical protein